MINTWLAGCADYMPVRRFSQYKGLPCRPDNWVHLPEPAHKWEKTDCSLVFSEHHARKVIKKETNSFPQKVKVHATLTSPPESECLLTYAANISTSQQILATSYLNSKTSGF